MDFGGLTRSRLGPAKALPPNLITYGFPYRDGAGKDRHEHIIVIEPSKIFNSVLDTWFFENLPCNKYSGNVLDAI